MRGRCVRMTCIVERGRRHAYTYNSNAPCPQRILFTFVCSIITYIKIFPLPPFTILSLFTSVLPSLTIYSNYHWQKPHMQTVHYNVMPSEPIRKFKLTASPTLFERGPPSLKKTSLIVFLGFWRKCHADACI